MPVLGTGYFVFNLTLSENRMLITFILRNKCSFEESAGEPLHWS